ncbi:MAG: cytochrome peroxidase [Gammaproteobacteria bacterium]|nr:cytochrome peroxidase [Gammaproteobacteria bacterium]
MCADTAEEPITPLPPAPVADPLRVSLGERLFSDTQLSRDDNRSCATCHDVNANGATHRQRDTTPEGAELNFNTTTVFNAALSFRLGWEGKYRTLESQIDALLRNPQIMGCAPETIAQKLQRNVSLTADFQAAYGRGPDAANVLDALATYQRTLTTPGSRFDRWLAGDTTALSRQEIGGYGLFKSLGCIACHQGMNVGGNLFEKQGIFHPLARPQPSILRVPSLRNVATTAPYFHDGSAPTLQVAVRKMGLAQLNTTLTDEQIDAIVAYLGTLTGVYGGKPVGGAE